MRVIPSAIYHFLALFGVYFGFVSASLVAFSLPLHTHALFGRPVAATAPPRATSCLPVFFALLPEHSAGWTYTTSHYYSHSPPFPLGGRAVPTFFDFPPCYCCISCSVAVRFSRTTFGILGRVFSCWLPFVGRFFTATCRFVAWVRLAAAFEQLALPSPFTWFVPFLGAVERRSRSFRDAPHHCTTTLRCFYRTTRTRYHSLPLPALAPVRVHTTCQTYHYTSFFAGRFVERCG